MAEQISPMDAAKSAAAARAAALVEDGMKVGLGTGSTAAFMVRHLAARIKDEGLRIIGVPTSEATADLARVLGVPLTTLDEAGWLDLTIDGADEFDPQMNLIKGGGAALLREKIVATASDRMVVIADAGKEVSRLGAFPLPVEVIPFGWASTRRHITDLLAQTPMAGAKIALRMRGDAPLLTDQRNYILDLHLGQIADAQGLWRALNQIAGVVENGLFIHLCEQVILATAQGDVRVITKGVSDV